MVEDISASTTTLEEGSGGPGSDLIEEKFDSATNFMQVQAQTDPPGGMLEIPVPQSRLKKPDVVSSRPSSAGAASSSGTSNRNSGVMVEEEAPTWLQQYGIK